MTATKHTTDTSEGTTVSWTRRGAGPAVVLVHGITESSLAWQPVAELLAEESEVIAIDLRGHGESSSADDHGLEAMAADITAVIAEAGIVRPHLVGHSLGGVVVSAVGAAIEVSSVVNIDQSLRLHEFKDQLAVVEDMLRDPEVFPTVMASLFDGMAGPALSETESVRLGGLRTYDQEVVLGVWRLVMESSVAEIAAAMDDMLAGYVGAGIPYLSLFGMDPGDDYRAWLVSRVPSAEVEVWSDHGHYPHLVDPQRFVARLKVFWAQVNP